ncbi:hypothetical protein, partial [Franconibacter helveticus]|uniref:hypothetical protein n=1 Tax=Franconibacter helveticus TaxID=357240 RepID=UPI001EFA06AF
MQTSNSFNSLICAGKAFGVVKAKYHSSQGILRLLGSSLAQVLTEPASNKIEISLVIDFMISLPAYSKL